MIGLQLRSLSALQRFGWVDPAGQLRVRARGRVSLSSSSRFPFSSVLRSASPVILPPGREKLATIPVSTGSLSLVITMGIVLVAALAAPVSVEPPVTMTSTFSRTNSAELRGA